MKIFANLKTKLISINLETKIRFLVYRLNEHKLEEGKKIIYPNQLCFYSNNKKYCTKKALCQNEFFCDDHDSNTIGQFATLFQSIRKKEINGVLLFYVFYIDAL